MMEEIKEVDLAEEELEEFGYTEFDSNLFNKLFNLDVSPYVASIKTKSANLKYLSWATAYQLLIHYDPKADVKICKAADGFPLFSRGNLHFVKTSITAFGLEKECWLPVMDYKHDAVTNPNARQIHDATMRCLAKNVALFGIGLKLYTGDDLEQYMNAPSFEQSQSMAKQGSKISKEQMDCINKLSKEKQVNFVEINNHCLQSYGVQVDAITQQQADIVMKMLENTPVPQR